MMYIRIGELLSFSNIFFVPFAGLTVILIDYFKKHPSDSTQKKLFTLLICFTLATMSCELIHSIIEGHPGTNLYNIHWVANTFYFFFQTVSFGLLVLFYEHTSNANSARFKKALIAVGIIYVVSAVLLIFNLFAGRMFYVTRDNFYTRGDLFLLVIVIPYTLVLIGFINVIIHRKQMNRALFFLLLISVIPAAIGSAFDILFAESRILWPGFFISLLFCYLFIIRITIKIDSLTNVFNRRGIDEYLLSIAKSLRRREHAFIMIDVDRFKSINDRFGHMQGDNALKDTAEILRSSVRRNDFVARYGGDEFIIIAETDNVNVIIENIKSKAQKFNMRQIRPYTLSLSCGGDIYLQDDLRTPLEFLSYVDSLMYTEKERRRK